VSDFGIDESFAEAATKVQEHDGFEIAAAAVRKATLESALQATRHHRQQEAQDPRLLPPRRARKSSSPKRTARSSAR